MTKQKEARDEKQKRNVIIIIIIAFAVLLTALMVCIVLLLKKSEDDQVESLDDMTPAAAALERGFVEKEVVDDIMEEMADKVAEGMFECKMTTTWTFEDSDSISPNAYVANVESNLHTIYFDVYEDGTDELLYSSPLLPVGTEFQSIKLEKKLPAGEYNAVVMYTLVDENYEEVSKVGFTVTISVLH